MSVYARGSSVPGLLSSSVEYFVAAACRAVAFANATPGLFNMPYTLVLILFFSIPCVRIANF